MQEVVIFGAGGLGSVVHDIFVAGKQYRTFAFLDSDKNLHGLTACGRPILGGLDKAISLIKNGVHHAIVAIGHNETRARLAEALVERGMTLVSAIHPLASIARSALLGPHVVVGPRAMICVHARIGAHSVVSSGAIVEHDNILGAAVHLDPAVRLAGGVCVGDRTTIGVGACVIPGRVIGSDATIDPGSVVIRDVADGQHVGGMPARRASEGGRFVPEPAETLAAAIGA